MYLRIIREGGVLCSSTKQIMRSNQHAISINNKQGADAVANERKHSAVRYGITVAQPWVVFKISEPNYKFNPLATELLRLRYKSMSAHTCYNEIKYWSTLARGQCSTPPV
jgi:hypothetical protein